mgnify:CR=1 FL=1
MSVGKYNNMVGIGALSSNSSKLKYLSKINLHFGEVFHKILKFLLKITLEFQDSFCNMPI